MALVETRSRDSALSSSRMRGLTRLGRIGPDACGEVELLAIATGSSLTQAAQLCERLGGSPGIVAASSAELVSAGLSPMRAAALVAAREIACRGTAALPDGRWIVRSPADLADRLLPSMGRLEREELRVAALNTKNVVIALATVYVGNLAGSSVRVGEVFRDAVRRNAASVLVIHNHPSGDPSPSGEDLRITAELAQAGRLLDIELLDHLVLGRDRWVSMRAAGAL